jgi:ribosome maturation protein Sdo1
MVRKQIQLTEDQVKALRKIAMTNRLSVAEIIRRAINRMIKSRVPVDHVERLRRALEIVGKFSSGKRDTSRKHDSCLADDLSK